MDVSRTMRILTIYCLFHDCAEVELREITDRIPVSKKTVLRDIGFLEQAGLIRFRFDRRLQAFIPQSAGGAEPIFPENGTQRRFMEKILRLCRIIREINGEEQPISWYRETFPELSDRTRQRDFRTLNELGITIRYCAGDGYTKGRWDCSYYGAFTLNTLC